MKLDPRSHAVFVFGASVGDSVLQFDSAGEYTRFHYGARGELLHQGIEGEWKIEHGQVVVTGEADIAFPPGFAPAIDEVQDAYRSYIASLVVS